MAVVSSSSLALVTELKNPAKVPRDRPLHLALLLKLYPVIHELALADRRPLVHSKACYVLSSTPF
jgi:hypothetical protein